MNKKTLLKLLMILLAVVAEGMALAPNSVTVAYIQEQKNVYYSYFAVIPDAPIQMATPMAAILGAVAGGLAITYAVRSKRGLLRAIQVVSFLAMCFSACPILLQQDPMVRPNVLHPICMGILFLVALMMYKKAETLADVSHEPQKLKKR